MQGISYFENALPTNAFTLFQPRSLRWPTIVENSHQDAGTFSEISGAGDDDGGPDFRLYGALEDTNYVVARPQSTSSDSLSSSLRTEAARKSLKSSSDQESDQSTVHSGASAAKRSISRDNSPAASGGSLRNAVSSDTSCEFRRVSIILDLVYGAPNAIGNDRSRRLDASLVDEIPSVLVIFDAIYDDLAGQPPALLESESPSRNQPLLKIFEMSL